jgi:hypothetical protein
MIKKQRNQPYSPKSGSQLPSVGARGKKKKVLKIIGYGNPNNTLESLCIIDEL